MTTTIAFSSATDGYIASSSTSYTTARNGTGTISADTSSTVLYWSQFLSGSTYWVDQAFMSFTYTVPSNEVVTAAYIRTKSTENLSTGVSRDLRIAEFDWGGTLTTADWRTPAQQDAFESAGLLATITNAEDAGAKYQMAGSDKLVTRLSSAGPLLVTAYASRSNENNAPTGNESSSFSSSDSSGTTDEPALVFTSAPESRLFGVLGAQVQLSDGTHAYLESSDQNGPSGADLTLKHHNGTSASTISPFTDVYFASAASGAQSYTLVADASDNLYLIGGSGTSMRVQAFVKGVGYTWTAQSNMTSALPSYTDGKLNNFAAAWHNVGTNGTIMVVASHTAGRAPNTTGDIVYALLNCQNLLAGSGTLLRNSGAARGVVTSSYTSSEYYTSYANEAGNSLDVVAAHGTTDRGYVFSVRPIQEPGGSFYLAAIRYILAAGGTTLSDVDDVSTNVNRGVKDADAKLRVIGVDGTTVVTVSVSENSTAGISVSVVQNTGTSSVVTFLGGAYLAADGLASMPSAATLSTSSAWDAIYDPSGEKLWIYYVHVSDPTKLMRTSIDMNTYLAAGDEVLVANMVAGAVQAIRVHRGTTQGQQVLISVAKSGPYATYYYTDTLNLAPNAPTLTTKSNYDATAAATFAWTFSDPNAGDTQSAYQLQIVDVSDGSVDVDTGKVTSGTSSRSITGGTLTNGKSYQWRVLTYDAQDTVGPYSSYGTFSTSAGGSVTITDPASDNPAGVNRDDYTVQWSVSGTTQASYRVVVTRTSTGATLVNTGYVTSTATSYNVIGMLTGVEYTIAVTVRNAALVESGTGTRKITPDYDNVPQPTISVTPSTAGYITINVTNPAPTGDNPAAASNQLLRRRSDSTGSYTLIATIDPDSSYDDYAVASGVTYEYIARAVA